MPKVVGVRFKRAGRVYYFDPGELELEPDDAVIVETSRGTELGWVVIAPKQVVESELGEPPRPVIRKAEPQDLRQLSHFKGREQDSFRRCKEKISRHGLPMKLVAAEYNFDGSRLTFLFTADGRVDFRDLVKDLAGTFRTRIELRQIGVRDEAKCIGGLGRCGRALCCSSFMREFAPVSIKMAKDQELPLNPTKISGICGRLMCCLAYENEQYCAAKHRMPRMNENIHTDQGIGRVVATNILNETVTVELETHATVVVPVSQTRRGAPDHCCAAAGDERRACRPA